MNPISSGASHSKALLSLSASLLLTISLTVSGCASGGYSTDYPLSSYTTTTREGAFQFRVPQGWFAANEDNIPTAHSIPIIWLMRNDYGATIGLSEVSVDSVARTELVPGPIERIARLTVSLSLNGGTSILHRSPETFRLGGREFCAYEVQHPESREVTRVVVFVAGTKVYELTALFQPRGPGEEALAVFGAQQSFLKSLRW